MIPGDVIAAGTATNQTITLDPTARTVGWVVMNTTAATIKFDTGPVITLPATNVQFIEFAGDYQAMTVTGTVSYFVVG